MVTFAATQRYSELRRRVPRMSEKMLTQRLAELTEEGLVARRRAVYALTARGRSAQPVLEALYAWGEAVAPQLGVTIAPPPERRAITARSASASDRGPSRR